jgi:hypothetical protein
VVLGVRESGLYRLTGKPILKNSGKKVVQTQRESNFRGGSQQAQRESQSSRGSQPSGSGGREESSKTVKKVSWVEMAMQDAQKREASRSRVSSKKGPSHTSRICFCVRGSSCGSGSSVGGRATSSVGDRELLPGDGGWNTSLAKREC